MNRLLLIDGSNLLFQMFFGMPARIVSRDGTAVQGTLGFVGALLKMIRMTDPTHAAVIFDGEQENSRCGVNPDYKANRTDYSTVSEKENPFSQLPDIYKALDLLNIKHTEAKNCEADDIIAAYALTYSGEDKETEAKTETETRTVIASFDSDFFQLISDKVSVLRYRGKKTVICTPEYVINRFGVAPEQYADLKSLTGDKADNIKGAEKVGIKTAAALLKEFNTLESILDSAQKIKKPSIKASIIKNSQRLRDNYKIIKLLNTAGLPFRMKELEYRPTDITTIKVLNEIGLYL